MVRLSKDLVIFLALRRKFAGQVAITYLKQKRTRFVQIYFSNVKIVNFRNILHQFEVFHKALHNVI